MSQPVNDVNVQAMKDFDKAVRENPVVGKRTVKVRSTWLRGTKALVEIGVQHAGGKQITPPTRRFILMADTPPALGGVDSGPSPMEVMLGALSGCVTAGIAANAALFDVPIDGLDVEMEADINFQGVLGHDKSVRNGFSDIRYTVTIQSPAPEEKVRRCKETIDRKSPVRDVLTAPVKVTSNFVYKQS
jgi:uncharacterized OsmC-like protein